MGWRFFTNDGRIKGQGAAGAAGATGPAGSNNVTIYFMSRPVLQTGLGRRAYADRALTISHIYVWATDGAPTSTLTLDVYKNGTSIFPTSTKPNLTVGNYVSGNFTPDTTSVAEHDKLEIYCSNTGGVRGRIGVAIVGTY